MCAQRARRGHALRGPRILWRLVEQCLLGSICSRLEQTGAQLSASPRLPLNYLHIPSVKIVGDFCYVLALCLGSRTDHGVLVQEGQRLPLHHAIVANPTRHSVEVKVPQGQEPFGKCRLLGWIVRRT